MPLCTGLLLPSFTGRTSLHAHACRLCRLLTGLAGGDVTTFALASLAVQMHAVQSYVQVIRPSGEVGKDITMGVFVRDIFLDQV